MAARLNARCIACGRRLARRRHRFWHAFVARHHPLVFLPRDAEEAAWAMAVWHRDTGR